MGGSRESLLVLVLVGASSSVSAQAVASDETGSALDAAAPGDAHDPVPDPPAAPRENVDVRDPVPDPPTPSLPAGFRPAPRAPLVGETPSGHETETVSTETEAREIPERLNRVTVTFGGTHPLFRPARARGFAQLEALGHRLSGVVTDLNLQLVRQVGPLVRLGAVASFLWTASHEAPIPGDVDLANSAHRVGVIEGVFALVRTFRRRSKIGVDLGLRATVGGGAVGWRYDDQPDHAALWRATLSGELALAFGSSGRSGIALRVGFATGRSGAMGPLDLRFDFSGPFGHAGFQHGF